MLLWHMHTLRASFPEHINTVITVVLFSKKEIRVALKRMLLTIHEYRDGFRRFSPACCLIFCFVLHILTIWISFSILKYRLERFTFTVLSLFSDFPRFACWLVSLNGSPLHPFDRWKQYFVNSSKYILVFGQIMTIPNWQMRWPSFGVRFGILSC